MSEVLKANVVVLGAGPGGYSAAFRAADLGKSVILIERFSSLGGVCLNVGCIPSKALLHVAQVIDEAKHASVSGLDFASPKIDKEKLVQWKNGIVKKLTGGLTMLAKARKVQVVTGIGKLISANQISVETEKGPVTVEFDQAILAAGSESVKLPFLPEDARIFSSTGALNLNDIKGDLLVIGGGIIGLEMATVYSALGAKVTVVEFMEQLMPGADLDLVKILQKRMAANGVEFILKTKVTDVQASSKCLTVSFEGAAGEKVEPREFQQILVSVGRKPNGKTIGAEAAGVHVDDRGFIPVNSQLQTNIPHIYAIGDLVGQPMLAHKSIPQGRIAAEVIAGMKHAFEPQCIPSVAYTNPEIAWAGLTEAEAKAKNISYEKAVFPWAASGRALSVGREEGATKLILDPESHRVLGCGIVGIHAGDLIAEAVLAIEMGCEAEDLGLIIHPHPTLSETMGLSAEIFEGTITDLYMPKKKD